MPNVQRYCPNDKAHPRRRNPPMSRLYVRRTPAKGPRRWVAIGWVCDPGNEFPGFYGARLGDGCGHVELDPTTE